MDMYYEQEMHLCCFEPLDLGIVCHYSIIQPIMIDTSTRLRDGIYINYSLSPATYLYAKSLDFFKCKFSPL